MRTAIAAAVSAASSAASTTVFVDVPPPPAPGRPTAVELAVIPDEATSDSSVPASFPASVESFCHTEAGRTPWELVPAAGDLPRAAGDSVAVGAGAAGGVVVVAAGGVTAAAAGGAGPPPVGGVGPCATTEPEAVGTCST